MKPIYLFLPAGLIFCGLVLAVDQGWLDAPTRIMISIATGAYMLGVTLALAVCGRFGGRPEADIVPQAPTT
jgi:hypothetical protein